MSKNMGDKKEAENEKQGYARVSYEDIWGAKMSGNQKLTATIDPDSLILIGTVQEKVSIKGHSVKETHNFSLPLPAGMDGTWSLEIDVNDDGKKMVGSSQMWLSNGDILSFSAKGKYNAKKDETKLNKQILVGPNHLIDFY
jgi:hypothetical protein